MWKKKKKKLKTKKEMQFSPNRGFLHMNGGL